MNETGPVPAHPRGEDLTRLMVTLGVALVFELPILIFFLTLLHIVTPGFLLRNSRYAILIIVIIAAIVTRFMVQSPWRAVGRLLRRRVDLEHARFVRPQRGQRHIVLDATARADGQRCGLRRADQGRRRVLPGRQGAIAGRAHRG